MKFTRSALLGVAAAAVASTVAFAAGHVETEGAVKARKAHMQLFAFELGILGNMAKGAIDFDADLAQRAASNMSALAMVDATDFWPAGSSSADIEGTKALPVIMEDNAGFMKIFADLETATAALAADTSSLDAVRAGLGPIGGACGACHKAYRESN